MQNHYSDHQIVFSTVKKFFYFLLVSEKQNLHKTLVTCFNHKSQLCKIITFGH